MSSGKLAWRPAGWPRLVKRSRRGSRSRQRRATGSPAAPAWAPPPRGGGACARGGRRSPPPRSTPKGALQARRLAHALAAWPDGQPRPHRAAHLIAVVAGVPGGPPPAEAGLDAPRTWAALAAEHGASRRSLEGLVEAARAAAAAASRRVALGRKARWAAWAWQSWHGEARALWRWVRSGPAPPQRPRAGGCGMGGRPPGQARRRGGALAAALGSPRRLPGGGRTLAARA